MKYVNPKRDLLSVFFSLIVNYDLTVVELLFPCREKDSSSDFLLVKISFEFG